MLIEYRYCGSNKDYCDARTCQKKFGTCWGSSPPPVRTTLSSVVRTSSHSTPSAAQPTCSAVTVTLPASTITIPGDGTTVTLPTTGMVTFVSTPSDPLLLITSQSLYQARERSSQSPSRRPSRLPVHYILLCSSLYDDHD